MYRYFDENHRALTAGAGHTEIKLDCEDNENNQWNNSANSSNIIWDGDTPRFKTSAELLSDITPEKIGELWQEAKEYQEKQLDSNGYTAMRFKATSGGEKAQANVDWVAQIWTDYKTRKTALELGNAVSFDFSNNGNMPHDFYEAEQEATS